MTKRSKLQNLLGKMTSFDDKIKGTFDSLDKEMQVVTEKLKETITAKTLDQVNEEFKNLQNTFKPLLTAFDELKVNLINRDESLREQLEQRLKELKTVLSTSQGLNQDRFLDISVEIGNVEADLSELKNRKPQEIPDFGSQIKDVESKLLALIPRERQDLVTEEELQKRIKELEEAIKKLRIEILSRETLGGGSMNRQIFIGGADPLTRYTDINLKAWSNVTITYANNNTTKKVDITIASSGGGGGSVGGMVRSITTTTVSSTIGSVVGTDYVVLANGGVQLTLPTASANTNLYTIKNIGSSSVLVNTVNSETIDDQSTVIMPVQYTSIDLISDSLNWKIT